MTEAGPPTGSRAVLESLCREVGVEPSYHSGGHLHHAPSGSLLDVVRSLGVLVNDAGDAERALRTVRRRRWRQPVEPVTVSWEGTPVEMEMRLPGRPGREPVEVALEREDGTTAECRIDPATAVRTPDRVEGRTVHTVRFELPLPVPPGYHDVALRCGAVSDRTRLIRAPRRAWVPEHAEGRWGTFLPLHAVRSRGSGGTGDVGDLRHLAEWTGQQGGSLVGTLPLYPLFLGPDRVDPGPYSPVSRLFWNPLYLELDRLPGLEAAPEARRLLESERYRERLRELEAGRRVEYAEAMEAKREVLAAVARTFAGPAMSSGEPSSGRVSARNETGSDALLDFAHGHPDVLHYAHFRTLGEERRTPWTEWPAGARSGRLDGGELDPDRVRYHLYAQWAMEHQMGRLAASDDAGLYLDLPLGSHPLGYDVWRHRDQFATEATTGAPPDAFQSDGQDWGFPPLHPWRSRQAGHDYWARCLRQIMSVSDAVRLDHVMGLHRLYWVPEGRPATEGVYVRYPTHELYAVLCLESHRARCEVVGEDLGTVPPEVPAAMADRDLRAMWVLPFEVAPGPPGEAAHYEPPAPHQLASLETHDLPPFAAFWKATDIDGRVEEGHMAPDQAARERAHRARWREAVVEVLTDQGIVGEASSDPSTPPELSAEEALEACLRLLAGSDATLVLVDLADLWLEEAPQNVPGTTDARNWTLRTPMPLDEIRQDERVTRLLALVDRLRSDSSLAPHPDP